MMRFTLFLFLFLAHITHAQRTVYTKSEVTQIEISPDGNNVVFASRDSIFITDTRLNSVLPILGFSLPSQVTSLEFIDSNKVKAVTKFNRVSLYNDFSLQDSTYIIDVEQGKVLAAASNAFVFCMDTENSMLYGVEHQVNTLNVQGSEVKALWPRSFYILRNGERIASAPIDFESIDQMKLSSEKSILIVVCKKDFKQHIQLYDANSLALLNELALGDQVVEEIQLFDAEGVLEYSSYQSYDKSDLTYSYKDVKNELSTIESVNLKIDRKLLTHSYLANNKFIGKNTKENSITYNIWANLTPLSRIRSGKQIDNRFVLLGGDRNKPIGDYSSGGAINLFDLEKEAFYVIPPRNKSKQLFDPSSAKMVSNELRNRLSPSSYQDWWITRKPLGYNSLNNAVEIWSVGKQQKLYSFFFENDVVASQVDGAGAYLLVVEKEQHMSFEDYRFHYINLETGKDSSIFFSGYDNEVSLFSGCDCYGVNDKEGSWVCSSKDDIFQLNVNGTPKLLHHFESEYEDRMSYTTITNMVSDGHKMVFDVIDDVSTKEDGYKIDYQQSQGKFLLNLTTHELKNIAENFEKDEVILAMNNEVFITSTKGGVNSYSKDLRQLHHYKGDGIPTKAFFSGDTLLVVYANQETQMNDRVNWKTNAPCGKMMVPEKSDVVDFRGELLFYIEDDHLITHSLENFQIVSVSVQQDLDKYLPTLQLNSSGNMVINDKLVIDLKNLASNNLTDGEDNYYWVTVGGENFKLVPSADYIDKNKTYETWFTLYSEFDVPVWKTQLNEKKYTGSYEVQYNSSGDIIVGFSTSKNYSTDGYKLIHIDRLSGKITPIIEKQYNGYDQKFNFKFCTKDNLLLFTEGSSSIFAEKPIQTLIDLNDFSQSKINKAVTANDFISDNQAFVYENGLKIIEFTKDRKTIVDTVFFYTRGDRIIEAAYKPLNKEVVAISEGSKLYVWKLDNPSPFKIIPLSNKKAVAMVEVNERIFVLLESYEVVILDASYDKIGVINIYDTGNGLDARYLLENGYYSMNKDNIWDVHFVYKGNTSNLSVSEVYFNRPDKVIESFGFATSEAVKELEKAYQKRLSKLGYDEEEKIIPEHQPKLKLLNYSQWPVGVREEDFVLELELEGVNKYGSLHVFCNGVPVFGSHGKDVEFAGRLDVPVKLNAKRNVLRMSVTDHLGLNSEFIEMDVRRIDSIPSPNLYFIGIGVKDYADANMNLKYSDKDIKDIAEMYAKNERYNKIYIDTFLNSSVTTAILPIIQERLASTTIHDQVIFMYSGHGLLDENLDYYLTTHDIDFSNPSVKGLPYAKVDELLDGIPARQKLVLIDACHSGEVDKDETTIASNKAGVQSTDFGKGDAFKRVEKTSNSFELMKEFFTDLRRGTGATVISSSSGLYFSFEDAKYQNGIYTYALKLGLEGAADANKDQEITVSELKDFLYEKVKELTDGKQQPNTRQENLEYDYRVW